MNSNKPRLFLIGLVVCLAGTGLIWSGDGSEHLFSKGVVVSGVALMVVGIGALRYLLLAK